jgi:hypothetical protein
MVKAIEGNKIAPWYADRGLAKNGYNSQQTDEPCDPDRPYNLWQPVDDTEDYGAHGVFDHRASNFSLELWGRLNWEKLAAAGAVLGLSGLLAGFMAKNKR